MQVFISWSGERSREIAEVFKWWLPKVIQAIKPFISTQDIAKGDYWSQKLGGVLSEYQFGIAILTPDNLSSPWMNFEAGALSKNLGLSKFMPILFGVEDNDLGQLPLNQFQNTKFDQQDIHKLIKDLNALQSLNPLTPGDLEDAFSMWWPQLNAKVDEINKKSASLSAVKPARPKPDDRLDSIERALADLTRMMRSARVRDWQPDYRRSPRMAEMVDMFDEVPYKRHLLETRNGYVEERRYPDGTIVRMPKKRIERFEQPKPIPMIEIPPEEPPGGDDSSQVNDAAEE